ncbi:hypothetical protein YC2023_093868 [Brassica napus]
MAASWIGESFGSADEIDHHFTDRSNVEHVVDPKILCSLIKSLKHLFQHSKDSFSLKILKILPNDWTYVACSQLTKQMLLAHKIKWVHIIDGRRANCKLASFALPMQYAVIPGRSCFSIHLFLFLAQLTETFVYIAFVMLRRIRPFVGSVQCPRCSLRITNDLLEGSYVPLWVSYATQSVKTRALCGMNIIWRYKLLLECPRKHKKLSNQRIYFLTVKKIDNCKNVSFEYDVSITESPT